ncbi:hypoxanthine phosphoribosyltransferase, partial [Dysosmobacter welbionis]
RRHAPVGGAGGQHLDKGEALAVHLLLECLLDGLLGLVDVGDIRDADPLGIGAAVQGGEHLRHADGHTGLLPGAALLAGSGLLADQSGGGHLTAGHAVDGIVDKDGRELLAPHGGVDDLRRADGGQVTVALVGEHRLMGMGALDAGSYGRRPAVGGLLHVAVEILVREDGAAHGAHADGVIQQTQL